MSYLCSVLRELPLLRTLDWPHGWEKSLAGARLCLLVWRCRYEELMHAAVYDIGVPLS